MWFKVDDSFYDHPKVFDTPDCAVALWLRAGTWSARNSTDGFVPAKLPARLCDDPDHAVKELCDRGMWKRTKGGYQFHDWSDYQITAAQARDLSDKRAAAGQKGGHAKATKQPSSKSLAHEGARSSENASKCDGESPLERYPPCDDQHESSGKGSSTCQASATGFAKQISSPYPNPYPSASNEALTPSIAAAIDGLTRDSADDHDKAAGHRPDADRLCRRMLEKLQVNGVKAKISQRWRDQARLLLDRDKRDLDQALTLIDWCADHHFWSANIHSIPKFREKYDKLRMQAEQQQRPTQMRLSTRDQRVAETQQLRAQLCSEQTSHNGTHLPAGGETW